MNPTKPDSHASGLKTLTDWYPSDVKPVRVGIYECNRLEYGSQRVKRFLYWNGARWFYNAPTDACPFAGGCAGMIRSDGDKWRGLTEQAK